MKTILILLFFTSLSFYSTAQCPGSAVTYAVDLSSQVDSTWISPPTARSGYACGASGLTTSIAFVVNINPSTTHVVFDIAIGVVGGVSYCNLNCGANIPLGTPICVSGQSNFCLSFSKSGTSVYGYRIRAFRDTNYVFVDTTIVNGNVTLSSNQFSATTFQWLDCNNAYTPIPLANSQSYAVSANGSYALEINRFGCVDTTTCISINNVSVKEISDNTLSCKLYPNPAKEYLNLEFPNAKKEETVIQIENVLGEIVYKTQTSEAFSTINSNHFVPAVYFIKIKQNEKQSALKFLKD